MLENAELTKQIEAIQNEIKEKTESLSSSKLVYEARKSFMDPKAGKISALMKEMKNVPKESKAEYGKAVNELKAWALEKFDALDKKMKEQEAKLRYESEKIDVTMPVKGKTVS